MSAADYFRQLEQARAAALALTLAQQRQFLELLQEYATEIAARIAASSAGSLPRRTLGELEYIIGRLTRDMAQSTGANIRLTANQVARIQHEATAKLMASAGVSAASFGSFEAVAARATQAMLARPELSQAFVTIRREAVADVDRILRRGVLRGAPSATIAREVRQYIVAPGSIVEGDAALLKDLRKIGYQQVIDLGYEASPENLARVRKEASTIAWKARRIARSEIMQTERETFIQGAIDSPVVAFVEIRLSYRHREKSACEPIARADLFGFGPGRYDPRLVPARPHPNCWCPHRNVLRPEEEWGEERGDLPPVLGNLDDVVEQFGLSPSQAQAFRQAVPTRERLAEDETPSAPVPVGPAPEPLPPLKTNLRAAESTLRNEKLEHAYVFAQDGKEIFHKTSGKKSAVYFTPAELTQMRDAILTHNHPNAGVSFSKADVKLAIRHDLQEIRAVDGARKLHIYRWIRPDSGWPADRESFILQVLDEVANAEAKVTVELEAAVSQGVMSSDDSWYELLHRAWTLVAEQLGLLYERERWEE